MLNISILDVPVLLASAQDGFQLVNHWSNLYDVGSRLYPAISISIGVAYGFAALFGSAPNQKRVVFVVAAALTLAMAPFTWVFMTPTNDALFRTAALGLAGVTTPMDDIQVLVVKWRWLHFVRSLFPLAGAMLGLRGAVF
jgi:hypothetical protein